MRERQDFTGQRFGRLLVIGTEILPNGKTRQICQCDCGKTVKVLTYTLKSDKKNRKTRSCGCLSADMARERALKNASRWSKNRWEGVTRSCQPGDRYGQLTVLSEAEPGSDGRRTVLCQCDCGIQKPIRAKDLLAGNYISCGCVRRQRLHDGMQRTHGHFEERTGSDVYTSWNNAKNRCYNQKDKSYDDYGGRGIKMCDRWRNSFEAFLEDMGARPSHDHSLDRINNDGDYEPGNCRWATKSEQNGNRRRFASLAEKLERLKLKRDRYIQLVETLETELSAAAVP
jgi:hypothetical protein